MKPGVAGYALLASLACCVVALLVLALDPVIQEIGRAGAKGSVTLNPQIK